MFCSSFYGIRIKNEILVIFSFFSVSLSCSDDLPSEYSLVLFVEFYETDENASYWTSRFWRAVNGALHPRSLDVSWYPQTEVKVLYLSLEGELKDLC